jgi:hypothetical protein
MKYWETKYLKTKQKYYVLIKNLNTYYDKTLNSSVFSIQIKITNDNIRKYLNRKEKLPW